MDKSSTRPSSAVERALGLLRTIAELDGESTLTELSSAQGLSRSVTSKLLKVLLEERLVQCDTSKKTYRAGLGLFLIAASVMGKATLLQISRAIMRDLVSTTNESTCLNLVDLGREAFTVAAVEESEEPLQYVIEVGRMHPLHAGASGKAILAFQSEEFIRRILSRDLPSVTGGTTTEPTKLTAQLSRVRDDGFCVSLGERLEGAVGVAAPIFALSPFAIGSVQLTIPKHRFQKASLDRLSTFVVEAAQQISNAAKVVHAQP